MSRYKASPPAPRQRPPRQSAEQAEEAAALASYHKLAAREGIPVEPPADPYLDPATIRRKARHGPTGTASRTPTP